MQRKKIFVLRSCRKGMMSRVFFFPRRKENVVAEFKASKQYIDILDTNYAAGFEDFRMDAIEKFPNVDFSSIILNLNAAATSSLLHTDSEDANIEDDAKTLPQDGSNVDTPLV